MSKPKQGQGGEAYRRCCPTPPSFFNRCRCTGSIIGTGAAGWLFLCGPLTATLERQREAEGFGQRFP